MDHKFGYLQNDFKCISYTPFLAHMHEASCYSVDFNCDNFILKIKIHTTK